MINYKVGDKSKGICGDCGLTETTFKIKDVPIANTNKVVKNILVATCDKCDCVIGIPQQSAANIKEELEK